MTKRVKTTLSVDKQYQEWITKQSFNNDIDKDEIKTRVLNEIEMLSSMSVEEYTLFKKWNEIRNGKHKNESQKTIDDIKNNIWRPSSLDDYKHLKPKLILASGKPKLTKVWNILRTFAVSLVNNGTIGRARRFLVVDEKTEKYLGIICVSSDMMDIAGRDNFIKWTREQKNSGMLKYTANCSTIVPFQPFGYNFNGGKLLALLCASDVVARDWEKKYGEKLVGLTTTSLYGTYSMYNSLKYWHRRGKTKGSVTFEFSKETEELIKAFGKTTEPEHYFKLWHAKKPNGQPVSRDHRNRSRQYFLRKLGKKLRTSLETFKEEYISIIFIKTPVISYVRRLKKSNWRNDMTTNWNHLLTYGNLDVLRNVLHL